MSEELMRGLTDTSIVKVNPFTKNIAKNEYGCMMFSNERGVLRVYVSNNVFEGKIAYCDVKGSNCWQREHLLVKGVDYT